MSAAQGHDAVTNTLLAVEEGDEIRLRARYYDWKRPLRVVSVQEIAWRAAAGEGWRTRTLSVDTDRSSHQFDVVEGIGIIDSTLGQGHGPVESVERVDDEPKPLSEPTDPKNDWWTCRPAAVPVSDTVDDRSLLGQDSTDEPADSNETDGADDESKADIASDIREHADEAPEPNRGAVSKTDLIQVGLRCGLAESIIGYPVRTIVAELGDELDVRIETGADGHPTRDGLETLRDAFVEQVPAPGYEGPHGATPSTGGGSW